MNNKLVLSSKPIGRDQSVEEQTKHGRTIEKWKFMLELFWILIGDRRGGSESNVATWFGTSMRRRGKCSEYRVFNKSDEIQGDRKVSVHLMIIIQKDTSNVQSVPPPVCWYLLTRRTVFSKTVFSTLRSTYRMYSVMATFRSSAVWRLFEYTESGAQRLLTWQRLMFRSYGCPTHSYVTSPQDRSPQDRYLTSHRYSARPSRLPSPTAEPAPEALLTRS